jgi:hypothetical protein
MFEIVIIQRHTNVVCMYACNSALFVQFLPSVLGQQLVPAFFGFVFVVLGGHEGTAGSRIQVLQIGVNKSVHGAVHHTRFVRAPIGRHFRIGELVHDLLSVNGATVKETNKIVSYCMYSLIFLYGSNFETDTTDD